MASAAPVRIGLVGFGKGGRYFHAPLIEEADGTALTAAVTRSAERRAELAARFPGARAFDSLAEMVESGAVDAVTVTTPLETHVPLVREAIALGVPVVCDKPFAADATTARAVVTEAEAAGVPLATYQNRRWDADMGTLRAVLATGEIGELELLEASMEEAPPAAGFSTTTGGGTLLDFGTHVVDQVLTVLGPAVRVYAEVHVVPGTDWDDRFFLALEHASGARSHVVADWTLHGDPAPRFRAHGSAGSLVVPSADGLSARLLAGEDAGAAGWGEVDAVATLARGADRREVPFERGAWAEFYAGWGAAVRGQGPLPVDPWDSVRALEVLDAARVSAAQRRVVGL